MFPCWHVAFLRNGEPVCQVSCRKFESYWAICCLAIGTLVSLHPTETRSWQVSSCQLHSGLQRSLWWKLMLNLIKYETRFATCLVAIWIPIGLYAAWRLASQSQCGSNDQVSM